MVDDVVNLEWNEKALKAYGRQYGIEFELIQLLIAVDQASRGEFLEMCNE